MNQQAESGCDDNGACLSQQTFENTSNNNGNVVRIPLGSDGDVNLIDEDLRLVEELRNASSSYPGQQNLILNSSGARIGNDVNITTSHANFVINNVIPCTASTNSQSPPQIGVKKPLPGLSLIRRHFKSLMILISTIILICSIALITLRFVSGGDTPIVTTIITTTTTTVPTSTKNPLIHYVFNRSAWGARDASGPIEVIKTPPSLVVIKHTNTATCNDVNSCFTAMLDLQNTDVGDFGLPDIRYNFVIGGDGNIYEGRGWRVRNEQMNDSIDLAFMGNFNVDEPRDAMVGAGPWMVLKGMLNGYLDYTSVKIVCHNQTEVTDSPGANLFRRVVNWTYYSPDIIGP